MSGEGYTVTRTDISNLHFGTWKNVRELVLQNDTPPTVKDMQRLHQLLDRMAVLNTESERMAGR